MWDYDHLSSFLTAPKAVVKGTAMAFAGLKKPDERANLIAGGGVFFLLLAGVLGYHVWSTS